MAFDWTDYLQLARELAKYGTEAGHRSAVSRAYYYVYHLALSRAESNGFVLLPGEGTHAQLWRVFKGSPDANCQYLATIGNRLKAKRVLADYDAAYGRLHEETLGLLADAETFATLLAKLPPRLPDPASMRQ